MDMIVYVEIPKELSKKLKILNEVIKATECKINMKNSVLFICTIHLKME